MFLLLGLPSLERRHMLIFLFCDLILCTDISVCISSVGSGVLLAIAYEHNRENVLSQMDPVAIHSRAAVLMSAHVPITIDIE